MNNIPDSVSFKQLASLLSEAPAQSPQPKVIQTDAALSVDWSERVQALLQEVEQSSEQASKGKSSQQVMALGSFRTHLWLGLQALKASGL